MEVKYTTLEQKLVSARESALKKFNSVRDEEGRLFGMKVYALENVKCDEELKTVFDSSQRAIWILENFTTEIPVGEKNWSDFEVTGIISFDGDIIVTSSHKLQQVIKRNISEAIEWIMSASGPNKVVVFNFGNDMNTYLWESNFKAFLGE
jgi:hypothetical protein